MSTETQTPRTDAEASDGWSGDAICVPADFARQLERDNAELRGKLERLAVYWADTATEAGLDAKEHKRLGDHEGHDIEDCRSCAFRACSAQLRAILNEGQKQS